MVAALIDVAQRAVTINATTALLPAHQISGLLEILFFVAYNSRSNFLQLVLWKKGMGYMQENSIAIQAILGLND